MPDEELLEAVRRQVETTLFAIAGERFRAQEKGHLGPSDQEESIRVTRAAIQILLTFRPDCPTCGGDGGGTEDGGTPNPWVRCKACNGSGKGLPALIRREELEQVKGYKQGVAFIRYPEPLYRLRPESEGASE